MDSRFEFSLEGRDWWKPFIPFWIVYLAYLAMSLAPRYKPGLEAGGARFWGYFALTMAFLFILVIAQSILTVVLGRIFAPKLSLAGHRVDFDGEVGAFVKLNVVGFLLSLITIGVYLPWYLRKIMAYLAAHVSVEGNKASFDGKGGRLFKYCLLSLWLPIIVVTVLFILAAKAWGFPSGGSPSLMTAVLSIFLFLVLVPFIYLTYRWYVDFTCSGIHVAWKTEFWPACLFLLGQLALTIITVGIYWPAAILKCWRYFAEQTVLTRGEEELGHLGFDGKIGSGFGLFWGQGLLCLITLGFYIPWGYARMSRWLIGATVYSGTAADGSSVPSPASEA
jgi:uncharacterized membrane protein YjgN (DUF898 family)